MSMSIPDTIFPTNNQYDIPALTTSVQAGVVDMPFVCWGTISRRAKMTGTYHFYTDDYRFNALLKRPEQLLKTGCITAVEINVSLFEQMPMVIALYRTYRKRWASRYWQSQGIRVIADLNVAPRYREINALGIPPGWTSFATRGYNNRVADTEAEYTQACTIAGHSNILFIVYGGGADVRALCQQHAGENWLYIPEQRDLVNQEAANG